jgi:hypothetical protein
MKIKYKRERGRLITRKKQRRKSDENRKKKKINYDLL